MIMVFKKLFLNLVYFGVFIVTTENSMAAISCEEHLRIVGDSKRFLAKADAITYLESVKAGCGTNQRFLSYLASLYFQNGEIDDAEKITLDALQRYPNNRQLLFGIGDVYLAKNKPDEAKKIAEGIIKSHPDWDGGYYLMQRALMDLRKFADSIPFGQQALQHKTTNYSVYYLNIAVAAYHSQQLELCVSSVEHALKIEPRVLKSAYGIDEAIYALDRLNRKREALTLAKRRKDADPDWKKDAALVHALKVMGVIE